MTPSDVAGRILPRGVVQPPWVTSRNMSCEVEHAVNQHGSLPSCTDVVGGRAGLIRRVALSWSLACLSNGRHSPRRHDKMKPLSHHRRDTTKSRPRGKELRSARKLPQVRRCSHYGVRTFEYSCPTAEHVCCAQDDRCSVGPQCSYIIAEPWFVSPDVEGSR
ncbi:hypothetical protein L227DRAFT_385871 [Lentinus tigrinus ALCF2SS1-6]|uniref:Uncharacterized protein n=1 Tax=Lentinus tigrinus ALCF2SS1-6 TaxID=1328759 RepID=A0A5C2SJ64_9APHY|nr:hypothetical protein L227DRAFT_385871 [Lentinus tigrinus ALCF2SS1-6]